MSKTPTLRGRTAAQIREDAATLRANTQLMPDEKTRNEAADHMLAAANKLEPEAAEEEAPSGPRYPDVEVQLSGQDGNAFIMASRTMTALKRAGVPTAERDEFFKEALSGDYDHVLQTIMAWVETS